MGHRQAALHKTRPEYIRRAQSEELEGRDVRVTAANLGRAIDLTIKVVGDACRELFPT